MKVFVKIILFFFEGSETEKGNTPIQKGEIDHRH